ncbi:AMP-binding protein [Streptomyces sp. FXJ1.4098]|nr:AMP-binding protein [Streptomyces sp. FXJ1.4098]
MCGAEPLPEPTPDDLVYVIYTSGTTGRPKGVRVTHRNVVRLVAADRLPFRFGPDDVWVLAHSYAFDFSVWEIFGCLVHGGRLVVPDGDELRDPRRMAELVRRHQVTVLNQTPGMFAQLVRVTDTEARRMASLRYAILGGARFAPATLGDWPAGHPGTEVVNMYGITETTVHVTARTITAEDIAADRSPIGTPIPTTTVRLLDPHPPRAGTGCCRSVRWGRSASAARGWRPGMWAAGAGARAVRTRPVRFRPPLPQR